jgi:hypothetical protein
MKICQKQHDPIVHHCLECPLCTALTELRKMKPKKGDRLEKYLKNLFKSAMTIYPGEKQELDLEFALFTDKWPTQWRFIAKNLEDDIAEQIRRGKKDWLKFSEYLVIKGWMSDDD